MFPDSGTPAAEACDPPSGAGTMHQDTIEADETWTAADSPHILTFDVHVRQGTLTIDPCAVVRIREGYTLSVGGTMGTPDAAIVAHGESITNGDGTSTVRPVIFEPDTAGTHWGSVRAGATGLIDFEHVILRDGGEQDTASNYGGAIVSLGAGGPQLTRNVRTVGVTIEDSEGFGANLQNFAAFTQDSMDLTIRGSGKAPSASNFVTDYPLFIVPPAVQTIPPGDYTQNKVDQIYVFNAGTVQMDETFPNRGVPYRLETGFSMSPTQAMQGGGGLTLTIEAGVKLLFVQTNPANPPYFQLGTSNGELPENIWPVKLIAQGTSTEPIVFTSGQTTPAAGDWLGITWRGGPSTGNVMSFVNIEYAGGDGGTTGFGCGPSDNDAALIITNWRPDNAFINNLTVMQSKAGGIVSGWRTDDDGPNLKTGNNFTQIGNGCEVSRWQNITPPACPGNDNIPDCF